MQDAKNLSPISPKPAQFNSQGQILLDITLPADQLKLETKPLGKGAFGVVYAARWGNRLVAVKQLLQSVLTDAEKEDFKKEGAIMFQMSAASDRVVRVYKITLQPYYSLVMELMPRGNLYDLLQNNRNTPLLWEVRYRLAMDISTGLSDIHSHGILHCDLKSLNVLLDDRLRAKLTDFGLASVRKNSTRSGASGMKGTPQWMAPEVVMGGKSSEASDVYSLGVILWELATHRTPYADFDNAMQVMFQIAQGNKETISEDCSKDFQALILDCWSVIAKRPKALQVVDRLQPLLESKVTVPTAAAGGVLDSLTSMQLKDGPAYQANVVSPPLPNISHPTATAAELLDSFTSVQLKGGPAYQASSIMPTHPTVAPKENKTPAAISLISTSLASAPYYQPEVAAKRKPGEEKTPGLAAFQAGYRLYHQNQYQQALPHLRQAAKEGYPLAYIDLGVMYELGSGVDKDAGEVTIWYEKAQKCESWFVQQADSEDAMSQFYLGRYYQFAAGTKKDLVKASAWYRRAAAQEHAVAQYNLSLCYEQGFGVPRDATQTATWRQRAAERGYATAQYDLAVCYEKGNGIAQNATQAVTWYRRAAEQGEARAQFALGVCCENGQGTKQDAKEAVTWYHCAAEQSNVGAQNTLAGCYLRGYGVAKDYSQAIRWYRKAAERGDKTAQINFDLLCKAVEREDAEAQFALGVCCENGQGIIEDRIEAVSWYHRAAEQGHGEAQCKLVICYINGVDVVKDRQQAKQWYEKVSAQDNEQAKNSLKCLLQANSFLANNPGLFFASSTIKLVGKLDPKALGQLLKCVAEGEQNQAEALIQKNPELLLAQGSVTDLSNRTFKNITAFQYALWAVDYHMWTMIQKYLLVEAQAEQYKTLENKGTSHGKHYNLQPLLGALRGYIDNAAKWNFDKQAREYWSENVGGAQKSLPAHVVNEYCRFDRSFIPCPTEWQSPLPRRQVVHDVWDGSKYVDAYWFSVPQLGASAAFSRCGGARPSLIGAAIMWRPSDLPNTDLPGLQALWNARIQQLKSLGVQLEAHLKSSQASPSSINSSSSFFAASNPPKLEGKVEAKQVTATLLQVVPKSVPEKSAAAAVVDEKPLGQLLRFVAAGEQDQAEALIKQDSKLLLAAGSVTDLSDRTFEDITAFQYALWAMDYHMWTMIQKYLPAEAQAEQCQLLESKSTVHDKHFDFKPVLEALRVYVDNAAKWNYDQRAVDQWCKKVGGAQKLLPAHVVNEYCRSDRAFDPCPAEWQSSLPRTRAVEIHDGSKWGKGGWFTPPAPAESLGSSFAFLRGRASAAGSRWGRRAGDLRGATTDLKSLQALWHARTQQLELLADTLAVALQSTTQMGLK